MRYDAPTTTSPVSADARCDEWSTDASEQMNSKGREDGR
jgi:hypothetical protein